MSRMVRNYLIVVHALDACYTNANVPRGEMRSRYLDANVEIELISYDLKNARSRTSATRCIETPMGSEGFYVEMLAILLCLVWF